MFKFPLALVGAVLLAQFARGADTPPLAVSVKDNHLVDGRGAILQLRGVNVSGLEFAPINGQPQPDGWGGQKPNLSAIAAWKVNALRVPLNEASYLGYTCYDPPSGAAHNPDPMGNYKSLLKQLVNDATSRGWYVILDLHKNAPNGLVKGKSVAIAPQSSAQNEMADSDHSLAFWSALAADYKNYPNVIFDLFNEPHLDNFVAPAGVAFADAAWTILRDGGTGKVYYGANMAFTQNWGIAGMQAMVDAVRSAGAKNVLMAAGISWSQDNSQWVKFAPKDPLKQLVLSWHAYPKFNEKFGTPNYNLPGFPQGYAWAQAVLDGGYPIIIGETGDQASDGTASAPFLDILLPWADKHDVSVIGWSWNAWGSKSADLIKDSSGTPTDGDGKAFKTWLANHK
ncbi:MAG TPA: glycoside hydrolase family 5 protein [Steroidobacteraceae bacterium]|jgi:aryl-phospho-beta-D-glucosidase BglC (GH1 family)|nr:glycoside hydrolase family 5 protein [Steroidobacteraceae bacterium]